MVRLANTTGICQPLLKYLINAKLRCFDKSIQTYLKLYPDMIEYYANHISNFTTTDYTIRIDNVEQTLMSLSHIYRTG